MSKEQIIVSTLGKTWILDIDGTICKHNGYKIDGYDTLLPGVQDFFKKIKNKDKIILITSRKKEDAYITEKFLKENNIHYDDIIYNVPYGERILINDEKPSGMKTAIAINTVRDVFCKIDFIEDKNI